jgi:hypothetical protein
MVEGLAKHLQLSWKSMQSIGLIRLVGHTDNTGLEKYNIDLGDRRARAVKEALQTLLRSDIIERRIRIAIVVDPSRGASAPTAENRTNEGRARNRRVEVFVAPAEPMPEAPEPPQPGAIDIKIRKDPGQSVIKTKPEPYWRPVTALPPGRSLKQWVDERLRALGISKWLRDKIWSAIVGKDYGLLNILLDAAGVSGAAKEAFLQSVRVLAETPARKHLSIEPDGVRNQEGPFKMIEQAMVGLAARGVVYLTQQCPDYGIYSPTREYFLDAQRKKVDPGAAGWQSGVRSRPCAPEAPPVALSDPRRSEPPDVDLGIRLEACPSPPEFCVETAGNALPKM